MSTTDQSTTHHDEAWLLLPWLASGRLSHQERMRVEEHVRLCSSCADELALQHRLCMALAEPDRVTYAPGPSFRKLLDRIDGATVQKPREPDKPVAPRSRTARGSGLAVWRPPGLAWAATFVLALGLGTLIATAYRWSEPLYTTHTDQTAATPNVLHIAFDRSLPIGEVEELLHSVGAHVVEGPGNTGIFGVTPDAVTSRQVNATTNREMRVLSARLRADPRVRWVEPVATVDAPTDQRASIPRAP